MSVIEIIVFLSILNTTLAPLALQTIGKQNAANREEEFPHGKGLQQCRLSTINFAPVLIQSTLDKILAGIQCTAGYIDGVIPDQLP